MLQLNTYGLSFDLNACRLGVMHSVSNLQINTSDIDVRRMVQSTMHSQLAHKIVTDRVEERRLDYTTEFRVEVYVLSANQLSELIQREALAIASRMNQPTLRDYK